MSSFNFSLDQYGLPTFQVSDPSYNALGGWLISDISRYMLVALDALAMIDDVSHGEEPFEQWSSENYVVNISPKGVTLSDVWTEGDRSEYPVADVRSALEDYWRFLSSQPENPNLVREYRPDLPEWQADLARWEEKWERTHPYRGRLF